MALSPEARRRKEKKVARKRSEYNSLKFLVYQILKFI